MLQWGHVVVDVEDVGLEWGHVVVDVEGFFAVVMGSAACATTTTTGQSSTPDATDAASPAQARRPMLEGTWQSTGVGPDLKLLSNGRFELGAVRGVWAAARIDETTGTLVLQTATGKERYRYELVGDTLRLKMEAEEQVRTFRRSM